MMHSVMFVVLYNVRCMNRFLFLIKTHCWVDDNEGKFKTLPQTDGFTSSPKYAVQAPTHN